MAWPVARAWEALAASFWTPSSLSSWSVSTEPKAEPPPVGAAPPAAPAPEEPSTEPTFHSEPDVSMLVSIGSVT